MSDDIELTKANAALWDRFVRLSSDYMQAKLKLSQEAAESRRRHVQFVAEQKAASKA